MQDSNLFFNHYRLEINLLWFCTEKLIIQFRSNRLLGVEKHWFSICFIFSRQQISAIMIHYVQKMPHRLSLETYYFIHFSEICFTFSHYVCLKLIYKTWLNEIHERTWNRTTLINVRGGGVKVCLLGNKSKMAFLVCLFKLSLAKATNMKHKAVFVSVLQIQSTGA